MFIEPLWYGSVCPAVWGSDAVKHRSISIEAVHAARGKTKVNTVEIVLSSA